MPMSEDFASRLYPILPELVEHYGTPFHIYDEEGVIKTGKKVTEAFSPLGGQFREFFAVKANPEPRILKIMAMDLDFGFDCSSIPELELARTYRNFHGKIFFTSNNTSDEEYHAALSRGGCILNLDDISFLDRLSVVPNLICFRYNPGPRRGGNSIIGEPKDAKYGVPHEQIVEAYRRAKKAGARLFGIHTMICSNVRDYKYLVQTVDDLLKVARLLEDELDIKMEFINMGGGLGIPYSPDDPFLDLKKMADGIISSLFKFEMERGYKPSLCMESGRYMTGPHGVLVTKIINKMSKYHEYYGVDACMSSLMRPALYDAYHHITIPARENGPRENFHVVGSLCENNDHFAKDRSLPIAEIGDTMVIHDTGAHGIAMGFNYNGRLRPKVLLLNRKGEAELIRSAETYEDYTRNMYPKPDILVPKLNRTKELV